MENRYNVIEYELIQLVPSGGAKCIWIDDAETETPSICEEDLPFLGIAKVKEFVYEQSDGNFRSKLIQETNLPNQVVGVQITQGYEQIVDEAVNFAGIKMPGQDVLKCLHNVSPEVIQKILSLQGVASEAVLNRKIETRVQKYMDDLEYDPSDMSDQPLYDRSIARQAYQDGLKDGIEGKY